MKWTNKWVMAAAVSVPVLFAATVGGASVEAAAERNANESSSRALLEIRLDKLPLVEKVHVGVLEHKHGEKDSHHEGGHSEEGTDHESTEEENADPGSNNEQYGDQGNMDEQDADPEVSESQKREKRALVDLDLKDSVLGERAHVGVLEHEHEVKDSQREGVQGDDANPEVSESQKREKRALVDLDLKESVLGDRLHVGVLEHEHEVKGSQREGVQGDDADPEVSESQKREKRALVDLDLKDSVLGDHVHVGVLEHEHEVKGSQREGFQGDDADPEVSESQKREKRALVDLDLKESVLGERLHVGVLEHEHEVKGSQREGVQGDAKTSERALLDLDLLDGIIGDTELSVLETVASRNDDGTRYTERSGVRLNLSPVLLPLDLNLGVLTSSSQTIPGQDDNAGGDNTGGDNAGGDNTGGDNTGGDNAGGDNTGGDNAGGDNTGSDNTGGDNTGGDNTGGDNAGGEGSDGFAAGNTDASEDSSTGESNSGNADPGAVEGGSGEQAGATDGLNSSRPRTGEVSLTEGNGSAAGSLGYSYSSERAEASLSGNAAFTPLLAGTNASIQEGSFPRTGGLLDSSWLVVAALALLLLGAGLTAYPTLRGKL
ncbi:ATP-dependent DNA helicase [Paenibacillus algicola]|uniref:ATP-dependent DNA helicase n=1 Tax=Paenibacillus algicola TaxID=2565926 RepID=A0A4P8XFQ5_9BACL|nr:hypothetical protein [Paenibacillus algicola]QCT01236.1 ATP-dependent DNA helicase [Paenibacillus algicola]